MIKVLYTYTTECNTTLRVLSGRSPLDTGCMLPSINCVLCSEVWVVSAENQVLLDLGWKRDDVYFSTVKDQLTQKKVTLIF